MNARWFVLGMLVVSGGVAVGIAADTKPAAGKTTKTSTPVKPKPVLVEDFEGRDLSRWILITRELKTQPDGSFALEQTTEDTLTLTLATDKKMVQGGKQALRVTYHPASDATGKEGLVVLRSGEVSMGERTALSFSALVLNGKGRMQLHLVDKDNVVRFHSQSIECVWKGWKKFSLTPADFNLTAERAEEWKSLWSGVKRLQFTVHGSLDLVFDTIEFTTP